MSYLNEFSEHALQPDNINLNLKIHQRTALYKMNKRETENVVEICKTTRSGIKKKYDVGTNIGILGDTVGTGKTLIVLSLISNNKLLNSYNTEHKCFKQTFIPKNLENFENINSNLIVVPHGLFYQWQEAITKYTNLTVYTIKSIRDKLDITLFEKHDIVLCNANKYNWLSQYCEQKMWSRIIFDEADTVNIPNANYSYAFFIWFVSSTYNRIRRPKNQGFIKDIFYTLKRNVGWYFFEELFQNMVIKNEPEFIKKSFILPNPIINIVKCYTPPYLNIIKDSVHSNVLNMLNAGDTEGALSTLKNINCKVDTNDNIIKIVTKNLENKIKGRKNTLENIDINNPNVEYMIMKKLEKEIADLENKLKYIKERMTNMEHCPICCDKIQNPSATLKCCKNIFCLKCLVTTLKINKTCPFCRIVINMTNDMLVIDKKNDKKVGSIIEKTKIDHLKEIILSKPNGKFIIFSDYDNTFTNIGSSIDNLKYRKLCGSGGHIRDVINDFNDGKINLLMLNSKHYGSGLNLDKATDLIIFHKLDKDTEKQVIGRANRLPRTDALNVYRLCYSYE